jgi:endonuclease/exonuclease/phosphatase family metal-dependent hydrolase
MRRHAWWRCCIGAIALTVAVAGAPAVAAASSRSGTSGGGDVRIATLNLLHGVFCPGGDFCQYKDRVALLEHQLTDAGCPDVVGLQEINKPLYQEIKKTRPGFCDGRYKLVFGPPKGIDTELVLTTMKVKSKKVQKLVGGFRTASRVVLEGPDGPVVAVVTHQEGDQDPGEPVVPCQRTCPPVCDGIGVLACQTVVAADMADQVGGDKATRVLMGDFNVTPASDRYKGLIADGWVDSYLATGGPECDPATSIGCTGGREDQAVEALKDPALQEHERIDFLFVKPAAGRECAFDDAADADGDGTPTKLFANEPATDGPGGLVWPSDHMGVIADFSCTPSS